MENRKIRVAITHGDTNGVGYEVIFKTFAAPEMLELCTPIIYGSPKVAAYHRKMLNLEATFSIINKAEDARDDRVNLLTTFDEEVKVEIGTPSKEAGMAALKALERAMADYRKGLFDVLVTGPINKDNIQCDTFRFCGHTEYLEDRVGDGQKALMILMNDYLRVALVTTHLPIRNVAQAITKEAIIEKATIFDRTLRRDLRISKPRIAVLALNPHAGDNGVLGTEEIDVITPAINELAQKGINAYGPYPADGFFGSGTYTAFDGVLAMYHDQGQTPFKALTSISEDKGVRVTAGLPLVRTAPAHGACFNLAGQNRIEADSMRHAIFEAIDIWRNRNNYDEPMGNPLQKLYHEKRDDSEKVRFSIPRSRREDREDREAFNINEEAE